MISLILRTTARFLHPVILLVSVFLLLNGHNEPGGGFTGGLMAAASFALLALAYDVARARRMLGVDPRSLMGVGLLVAAASGIFGWAAGRPFLTGMWLKLELSNIEIDLGTPLLFDIGVYLLVVGVVLLMIFSMAEE